ncbi:MAG: hypothetical protein ACREA3_03585 [Nitrosotalea sp.]
MKTLHLSIILIIVSIMVVPSAHNVRAIPYMSPDDLYKQSYMVFYGQVISKQAASQPDYHYYQIKVEKYFKNPQTSDSITAAGPKSSEGHVTYPQFEVGDKAIFYINKLNGINTISPYSQIAGEACGGNSFESSPIWSKKIVGPAPSTHIYIEDANGNMPYIPLTNHTAVFHDDDVWNNYPEPRTVTVTLSIQDEDTGQQVFNKTQNLEMQACSGPGKVEWDFVPTQIANYVATVSDDKSNIGESFNSIYDPKGFFEQFIRSSPLQQIKIGIAANNVKCNDGLQLVIKAEDGTPACVKPDTASILVERGWAQTIIGNMSNTKNNDPFGITALVIYKPSLGCLGPPGNGTSGGCPLNNFYLKINSNSTAYLLGYNICDGSSCTKSSGLSVLLPTNTILTPNYQLIGLPVNLQWEDGDTVSIQLQVSPTLDNKTGLLIDHGNSTIVP